MCCPNHTTLEKYLKKFKQHNIISAKTAVDLNQNWVKNSGDSVYQLEYSRIVGSIMYVMTCTRPDIAYAVNKHSRYTTNLGKNRWKAIIRVLGYLRYTQSHGLHYDRYPSVIEGYCDANWITGSSDTKSTSGYVFTLASGAISWRSSNKLI